MSDEQLRVALIISRTLSGLAVGYWAAMVVQNHSQPPLVVALQLLGAAIIAAMLLIHFYAYEWRWSS